MDARQRTVKKVFTKEQLSKMSIEDIATLVGKAGQGASFKGTAIVRKADGTIRCAEGVNPAQFEGV